MSIPEKFLKPYNPAETEKTVYETWEQSEYFNPDNLPGERSEPYSIVLPPPNVTGTLHIGHSMMLAVQDIVIRYKRMQGFKTLWIPGTDHAAIATQSKVEEIIYKKDGKTRFDFTREDFLKQVGDFAQESHDTIVNQVKKIGCSLDWSREAFTLDEKRTKAVRTAFKKMFDDNLIYRGARIVNWDPKLKTTVSDDEVDHVEEKTSLYYLKYGPFTITTARPETKFGDKYVVMHPNDPRFSQYHDGQILKVEWINGPITATVIKDTAIDMEFGTGVMTITPAHSLIDFEIAKRHELAYEQIIDQKGLLLPIAGEFAGTHIKKARLLIIEKLQAKGLVEKIDENYVHNISVNSRGGGIIEPQILMQWFVDVNKQFVLKESRIPGIQSGSKTSLKEMMRKAVEGGGVTVLPDRFLKTYNHWVENLRDWCISRQLWYGHRIPVWYRGEEAYCGLEAPEGEGWTQDEDTLDTWFSSGLWTFSTLGWPDETADLKTFHPTNLLETGYDILFFWVARMILMSGYLLGDVPFKTVYLHGLVRDQKGQKMSKSLGNIIDPLTMVEKYGADALRMSLIIGTAPGSDSRMAEDKIKAQKLFANKIWNATRFVLSSVDSTELAAEPKLTDIQKSYKEELDSLVKEVTLDMENYRFYLAGDKLYHYFWHRFADIIIEESKTLLTNEDTEVVYATKWMLFHILTTTLKLLHPFMPFITEEIWNALPTQRKNLLIVEPWPKV